MVARLIADVFVCVRMCVLWAATWQGYEAGPRRRFVRRKSRPRSRNPVRTASRLQLICRLGAGVVFSPVLPLFRDTAHSQVASFRPGRLLWTRLPRSLACSLARLLSKLSVQFCLHAQIARDRYSDRYSNGRTCSATIPLLVSYTRKSRRSWWNSKLSTWWYSRMVASLVCKHSPMILIGSTVSLFGEVDLSAVQTPAAVLLGPLVAVLPKDLHHDETRDPEP